MWYFLDHSEASLQLLNHGYQRVPKFSRTFQGGNPLLSYIHVRPNLAVHTDAALLQLSLCNDDCGEFVVVILNSFNPGY